MPAFPGEAPAVGDGVVDVGLAADGREFEVLKQKVDLDIDFAARTLKGSTEITIEPKIRDLTEIRLHCRQCKPTTIQVGGITARWEYDDTYHRSRMPELSDVHQHHMLKDRIQKSLRPTPEPELVVTLPAKFKIQELHVDGGAVRPPVPTLQKTDSDAMAFADNTAAPTAQQGPSFTPFKLFIEFEIASFRDGIHWIGHAEGDKRFPCMYTKAEPWAGNSSCLFPCVDNATSRCSWDISIRCPKTLGDAFRRPPTGGNTNGDFQMLNGNDDPVSPEDKYLIDLAEDEAAMELTVVCVGETVDDISDAEDPSRHTVSFSVTQPVAARHVGFAIGPFEYVDLSSSRDSDQEDRLGQSAMKISGYCMPHRSQDVENTCMPISLAMDDMGIKYGSYPFTSYQMIFLDDLVHDTVPVAGLSFCSSELLFPKEVIEPLYRNTKILVRTLADQWMGVYVIAKEASDAWIVAGVAGFMTDSYLKDLCGNNEFRWQQKMAAEKVYELDVDRPSIKSLGELVHLDRSIRDFIDLKSALVLFILDRRLMKASGSTGVQRIVNKIFLQARTGGLVNGEVSTIDFQRTCERLGHNKLELFFRQWVIGSGVPIFEATQRFNKKKLVVEMTITQRQLDRQTKPQFEPSNFMREIKEHVQEVWAPETNAVFTGPMTIRIHEADGTPYEHIVEIKEAITKLEIPYNTKYKRLKRSRRQKERQVAETANGEEGTDSLLYCLGDVLDSDEEKREWNLVDWTTEDEEKMGQENYEWIRLDADFEWIGRIHLKQPLYMYISQLQQDRDIVAQYESMRYLIGSNQHHVNLSILVRTLMDERYFWGIRKMAADGFAECGSGRLVDVAQFHLIKAFRTLFCMPDTNMPKSNDFSDRRTFVIQCAIPRAMALLRDDEGKVPMQIRQFFVDLLKFNDNSSNFMDDGESLYSDNHYIATLMNCLADSLVASHRVKQSSYTFTFGDDEPMEDDYDPDADFAPIAIAQIERHRRIDEFESSYQNIYSVTALECMQRLLKAGIVKDKQTEVMKYVRSGNAPIVRLTAWRSLSEIGALRGMNALRFLLHSLQEDPSPRFREQLLVIFGEALGHIALGDSEPPPVAAPPPADGLILEQEPTNEARRLAAMRKTTPEGALVALQNALKNEATFKSALWHVATSPDLTLDEVSALCDIAALVFEPVNALKISLSLPRMWKCTHLGAGKLKFTAFGPFRDRPQKKLALPDVERLEELGLTYRGPKVELEKKQVEAPIKLKLGGLQREVEATTTAFGIGEMLPPMTVAPSVERPPLAPIKLGIKRKSTDMDGKAGSPKVLKAFKEQSPSVQTATPKAKTNAARRRSSTPRDRRSSTPGSRTSAAKPRPSRLVTLRFTRHIARAQQILAAIPPPVLWAPPSLSQQVSGPIAPGLPQGSPTYTPGLLSPSQGMYLGGGSFSSQTPQPMNLGAFRSYDAPQPDPVHVQEVRQEEPTVGLIDLKSAPPAIVNDGLSSASPVNYNTDMETSEDNFEPDIPLAEIKRQQAMAPPPQQPRPKLKLKFGGGKPKT